METFIPKESIPDLVRHLMKSYRVVAPTAKGPAFVFTVITDPATVVLDYPTTILPPKKYLLPSKEELLRFNRATGAATVAPAEVEPTVFLGVHSYDMQGVLRLDFIMKDGNPDKTYIARRENTHFIGTTFTPDEQHFSESLGIATDAKDGFDAFLTPVAGGYILNLLGPIGEKILKSFNSTAKSAPPAPRKVVFQKKVMPELARVPAILEKAYGSEVWKSAGAKCLSCGSCNLVCPTCYCFDVEDDVELNLADGSRSRQWDGCQLATFAMVAGGENFRHGRDARVRHRVYRKFRYLADKYPKPFCVGCGRCNRACTARLNIVELINEAAATL